MSDPKHDQEPTHPRWTWRLGSLVGIENDQLVGTLDPEHVGERLAVRGTAPRGIA